MTKFDDFDYRYTGDAQPSYNPQNPKDLVRDEEGRVYYPYLPSPDLKKAVELAIALERPLLLEGEPGCGKTRLASAIAYEYTQRYRSTHKNEQFRWWPYYTWNVKSTTRARDGLYTFDAVARLRDAQLMATVKSTQLRTADPKGLSEVLGEDAIELEKQLKETDRDRYRKFGPLGNALWQDPNSEWKHNLRPIVLIDEIDKADSDFPNDLLLELEELRFEIPETGDSVKPPKQKPIIFITSNREKPLPDPLLRRCLYFYVEFPDPEHLTDIIQKRFGKLDMEREEVVTKAVERFFYIRDVITNPPRSRPPGTSEFIDFLSVLLGYSSAAEAMGELEDLSSHLPLLGTLLKTQADQTRFQQSS